MRAPARAGRVARPLLRLLEEHFDAGALPAFLGLEQAPPPPSLWEDALLGPLRDLLGRPSKELRGRLVSAAWSLAGGRGAPPQELPLLVELLHAGSLVVDDIEDGSVTRRGGPALHRRYGLPVALNAGNWLYFWPQALLARLGLPEPVELELHRLVARTLLRCHHGQALDLSVRVGALAQREVPAVVTAVTGLKTGSLFELSASLGAMAAGASPPRVRALAHFGQRLGVGLQMLDDLGSLESAHRRHKGLEDVCLGRPTWPWAWLAERMERMRYARLRAKAREAEQEPVAAEELLDALRVSLARVGRSRVRAHLRLGLSELRQATGPSPVHRLLKDEVARMERSYG